jgi:hypothetical protein
MGFGCVIALLGAELGLRACGYAGDHARVHSVFDRRYGEVPRDSWIWNFEIDPMRHHAVDLHGELLALPKPHAERRVLFLGDSATEGAFVGPDQNFPRVFKTLLDARSPDNQLRAINAGVWGMTTIDEYHLLEDKLLPLEPDVVVLGLFMANDINMNLAHRERRAQTDQRGWDYLRNHSALAHFVYTRLLALGARPGFASHSVLAPVDFGLVDSRGLSMLSYPAGELATYLQPSSSLVDHAYQVLSSVLSDFKALGAKHAFTLRVLIIPSPSRVLGRLAILHYPNLLRELAAQGVNIEPSAIDVDAPTRRVLALCAQLEIACVDPTRQLQRLGARAFFPHDEHPTALAHQALAQALLSQ